MLIVYQNTWQFST